MGDFIGGLITKGIYWIIPIALVASFLVNHKVPSNGGQGGEQEETKPSKKETSGGNDAKAQGSLDAPISEKDMTE